MKKHQNLIQQIWHEVHSLKPSVVEKSEKSLPKNKAERDALQSRLAAACVASDADLIMEVCEEGGDINTLVPIELPTMRKGKHDVNWVHPLHYFASKGNTSVIKWLHEQEPLSLDLTVEHQEKNVMEYALKSKNQELIKLLVTIGVPYQKLAMDGCHNVKDLYLEKLSSSEFPSDFIIWWVDNFYQNDLGNIVKLGNFHEDWLDHFIQKMVERVSDVHNVKFVKQLLETTSPKTWSHYHNNSVVMVESGSIPIRPSQEIIDMLWIRAMRKDDDASISELLHNDWVIDPLSPKKFEGFYYQYDSRYYDQEDLNFLSRAIEIRAQKIVAMMLVSPLVVKVLNDAITQSNAGQKPKGFSGLLYSLKHAQVQIVESMFKHQVHLETIRDTAHPGDNWAHTIRRCNRLTKTMVNCLIKNNLDHILLQENANKQLPFDLKVEQYSSSVDVDMPELKAYYEKSMLSKMVKKKVKRKEVSLDVGKKRRM